MVRNVTLARELGLLRISDRMLAADTEIDDHSVCEFLGCALDDAFATCGVGYSHYLVLILVSRECEL